MPSLDQADRTLELGNEDLIAVPPPGAPSESTIRLSADDVVVLEELAAAAEVVIRPDLLQPLPRHTALLRTSRAALDRVAPAGRAVAGLAARGWAVMRRRTALARAAALPALRAALAAMAALLCTARSGLRRGARAAWDATFPLRDWAGLKLRRYAPRADRAPLVRPASVADRALIADLQRALEAYSHGQSSKLMVAELDGRVAILVPGREPKVEVECQPRTDPTALGRHAMIAR